MSCDWSPTGREFVSGSYDRTLRLWKQGQGGSRDTYHTKRMQRCVPSIHRMIDPLTPKLPGLTLFFSRSQCFRDRLHSRLALRPVRLGRREPANLESAREREARRRRQARASPERVPRRPPREMGHRRRRRQGRTDAVPPETDPQGERTQARDARSEEDQGGAPDPARAARSRQRVAQAQAGAQGADCKSRAVAPLVSCTCFALLAASGIHITLSQLASSPSTYVSPERFSCAAALQYLSTPSTLSRSRLVRAGTLRVLGSETI